MFILGSACIGWSQDQTRTIVPVYLGGGFIYSVKGYDQERYGSNPWWSLVGGTGLSLSSKTFLIAKVGYLFHHEFKNVSTVPLTVEYSWEHLLVSIGVMYKIPVRDYFEVNIDAGVSWLGFFGNNYLGDLVKPNDSFFCRNL